MRLLGHIFPEGMSFSSANMPVNHTGTGADLITSATFGSCVTFSPMSKDTLIPDELNPLIWINPERMSGAPCFYGTRLPVSSLFENLEGGVSINEWLDAFPSVTREQAIAVLEYARNRMLEPVA